MLTLEIQPKQFGVFFTQDKFLTSDYKTGCGPAQQTLL